MTKEGSLVKTLVRTSGASFVVLGYAVLGAVSVIALPESHYQAATPLHSDNGTVPTAGAGGIVHYPGTWVDDSCEPSFRGSCPDPIDYLDLWRSYCSERHAHSGHLFGGCSGRLFCLHCRPFFGRATCGQQGCHDCQPHSAPDVLKGNVIPTEPVHTTHVEGKETVEVSEDSFEYPDDSILAPSNSIPEMQVPQQPLPQPVAPPAPDVSLPSQPTEPTELPSRDPSNTDEAPLPRNDLPTGRRDYDGRYAKQPEQTVSPKLLRDQSAQLPPEPSTRVKTASASSNEGTTRLLRQLKYLSER